MVGRETVTDYRGASLLENNWVKPSATVETPALPETAKQGTGSGTNRSFLVGVLVVGVVVWWILRKKG
jgi:hypothetical protein